MEVEDEVGTNGADHLTFHTHRMAGLAGAAVPKDNLLWVVAHLHVGPLAGRIMFNSI